MDRDVHGFVFHVTEHRSGRIDIGFYDKDLDRTVTYSTGAKQGRLTKRLAQTLAGTLARNIWVKMRIEKGVVTEVSMEEYDFGKDVYNLKKKLRKLVITGS